MKVFGGMKVKKVVLVIIICFMMMGCGSGKLKKAYENMQIGKDLRGYAIDLRIYGKVGEERVNEIVKIYNYNDTDYKIAEKVSNDSIEEKISVGDDEKTTYIKDGKIYIQNDEGEYIETTDKVIYSNPRVFLEGIKRANKDAVREQKIGQKTYDVYDFKISKNIVNNIFDEIGISNFKFEKTPRVEAYIDAEEFVYRIIYYVDDLVINVNYFSINNVDSISVPTTNDLIIQ